MDAISLLKRVKCLKYLDDKGPIQRPYLDKLIKDIDIFLDTLSQQSLSGSETKVSSPKFPSFYMLKKHMQNEINEGLELDHLLSAYHEIKKLGNF